MSIYQKPVAILATLMMILALPIITRADNDVSEPSGTFPEDEFVQVAGIALDPGNAPVDVAQSVVERYKKGLADKVEHFVREAAKHGAKMVVTPEFSLVGYPDIPELSEEEDDFQNPQQILQYAETMSGPSVKRFSALAKELDIFLTIGIAEKGSGREEVFNTLVVLDPKGKIVTSYRKINLFGLEHKFLQPGSKRVFWESPWGRVGMMTCCDINFQDPADDLVERDHIKIMAFSSSWVGKNPLGTFSRWACGHKVWFIAANDTYFPGSGVFDPQGNMQSHVVKAEGPAYGFIKIKDTRRR